MKKLILAAQVTLDGFIEGPDGEIDWIISGEEEWNELFRDLKSIDTILLGRKMYPGYSGYWKSVLNNPTASRNELEYARFADRTPHILFSKTMSSADWANTRIVSDAAREVSLLKQQDGKDMVLWGGATIASTFTALGMIDEYRLTLNPILLGSGKPLFHNLKDRKKLKLIDSKPLKSGNVILRYQAN